ncbi:uncharacterized protein LOC100869260 isoform X1 [Apis florea]|uniref:uncharacterized protein LOC100869260 isoform X1 n=1 Tax=Apis florea TaxID=7463 RepID=UPI0012FF46DD|nr:uncharacterized protein LOC100869260 isoform X1 [Apis florea]
MIAHRGGDSSLVFRLLFFPLILVASGHEFARNGTVIPDNDHYVNPSNVSSSVTSHGTEMEARSDGELSVTRSVERKSGGPFSYRRDSYLEALRHSRTSTDPREGIVDVVGSGSFHRRKEQSLGPVYTTKRSEIPVSSSSRIVHVDRDSFSMVPSDSYSLPTRTSADFNGVKNTYGPPQSSYGSPSYGPPPSNDYSYGTSGGGYSPYQPQQGETRAYGAPHGISDSVQLSLPSIDFSWPFALKLNAFTLAKILLKLVIFKMIVKFIAVICLLLFIPKLEIKKGNKGNNMEGSNDDEDEGRRFLNANSMVWDRLNRLTLVVHDAMKQYGVDVVKPRSECSTLQCQIQRAFEHDESWPDYEQLLQNYIMEEARLIRDKF